MRIRSIPEPIDALARRPDVVWMSTDTTILGWGEALRLGAGLGPDRFRRAEDAFRSWLVDNDGDERVVSVSSFSFDERSSGSLLTVPAVAVIRRGTDWIAVETDDRRIEDILDAPPPPAPERDRPRFAGASIPDHVWLDAVADAVDAIRDGDLEKVVLARDHALWSKTPFDPVRLLARLAERFPECFVFQVDGLVGASPEMLIRRTGRSVESLALAGTAARSDDPVDDEQLGKELFASDKDRREHESAAASVGRVLGGLCERLERDPVPTLLRLANVQHLATRFQGQLAGRHSALEIAGRLHPTAAVGGTPPATAIDVIRRLEPMDRGRYAGPVGWMDGAGDGCFAIALRCAEISGARARLFAGAGIVDGSLPEAELEETRIKLLAMQSAFD